MPRHGANRPELAQRKGPVMQAAFFTRLAALAAVAALVQIPQVAPAEAATTALPSHEVTDGGQTEYNYEALLQQLFADGAQLCGTLTVTIDYVRDDSAQLVDQPEEPRSEGENTSLGNCPRYDFTFAHLGAKRFPHLEPSSWFALTHWHGAESTFRHHQRPGAHPISAMWPASVGHRAARRRGGVVGANMRCFPLA